MGALCTVDMEIIAYILYIVKRAGVEKQNLLLGDYKLNNFYSEEHKLASPTKEWIYRVSDQQKLRDIPTSAVK